MGRERLEAIWSNYTKRNAQASELAKGDHFDYAASEYDKDVLAHEMKYAKRTLIDALPEEKRGEAEALFKVEVVPDTFLESDSKALFDMLEGSLDAAAIDSLSDSIETYVVPGDRFDNHVRLLSDEVAERKAEIEKSDMSAEDKAKLFAALERADAAVLGDSEDAIGMRSPKAEDYGKAIDRDRSDKIRTSVKEAPDGILSELIGEYNRFGTSTFGVNYETISPDPTVLAKARAVKFEISDSSRAAIREICDILNEGGMTAYDTFEPPDLVKSPTTQRLNGVIDELRDAIIDGKSAEEISELTDRYEKFIAAYDKAYKAGERLFEGSEFIGFNSNMSTYRVPSTQPQFKTNIRVNSNITSISFIQEFCARTEISLDDLLADPVAALQDGANRWNNKYGVNKYNDGNRTLGEQLARLQRAREDDPTLGLLATGGSVPQIIGAMLEMEPDREVRDRNLALVMFLEKDLMQMFNRTTELGSFDSRFTDCTKDIFLVNDEDRDFSDFAVGSVDMATMKKRGGFDAMGYLDTHEIDPAALKDRIVDGILDFSKAGGKNVSGLVESARKTVEDVIIVKGLDPKSPEFKALAAFHDNPAKVLAAEAKKRGMNAPSIHAKKLDSIATKRKEVVAREKAIDKEQKAFQKGENAFNKRAKAIVKRIEQGQKALEKNPDNIAAKKKLEQDERMLAFICDRHRQILEQGVASGKVTPLYFTARMADIRAAKFDTQRGMFTEGLADRKTYVAERMADGMSKKDAEAAFKQASARERAEMRIMAGREVRGLSPKQYAEPTKAAPISEPTKETPKTELRREEPKAEPVAHNRHKADLSAHLPKKQPLRQTTQKESAAPVQSKERVTAKDEPN